MLTILTLSVLDTLFLNTFYILCGIGFLHIKWCLKKGNITTGVIVDFITREDPDQQTHYAPIVKFTAESGIEYTIESDHYRMETPEINTAVPVCYESDNPSDAIIEPRRLMIFNLILLILVFLVLVGLNAGFYYKGMEN